MRAIELNGCSGGMAEGFRRAGITFNWCFDWDPDACASYERNLGHRPIRMDIRDVVRMVRGGWSPGPLDLLVADPPCTPWSRAGKRQGTADGRDMLVETCDLIALLRPRAFLIGNVPGLQDASSWGVVQRVIGGLARHGYCCADYAQLDAADYGVPQRRIRPFWFGHLAGPCLVWPAPTHGKPTATGALPGMALRPWVTCRQALSHLPPEEMGRPVRLRWKPTDDHRPSAIDEPAKALTTNTHSDGSLLVASRDVVPRLHDGHALTGPSTKHPGHPEDGPAKIIRGGGDGHSAPQAVLTLNGRHAPADLDHPAPTVAAKVRQQGAQVLRTDEPHGHPTSKADQPAWVITAEGGRAGKRSTVLEGMRPAQGLRTGTADAPSSTMDCKTDRIGAGASHVIEWPWDRPATTLARDERIPPPGHHQANSYLSAPNAIVLSERAAAILQGFPQRWVFLGKTKRSRWSQLGQAMPPGLAEAVARSVARQLAATTAAAERAHEMQRLLESEECA
jgi:site-specific DNA-cytosine methylase